MPSSRQPLQPPRLTLGYTMVELVVVLVLVGVLSAFALPKMQSAMGVRDDAWRDGLLSGLRYAQKTAVSHRRLVCATVSNTQLTLTIASVNPATACNTALAGPSGTTGAHATSSNSAATTSVAPGGVIYFQPDGRVTSDGAGLTASSRVITTSGVSATIQITGETGHVQ